MQFKFAQKKITDYEYQRNKLLILSSVLLVVLILETICLLFKQEKIIILPPELKREFWVEGNKFSPEYLEEQAVYMIHLALDVNQVSYPYNMEILMRYADMETCNYLREEFEKNHKKLKQNDASTRFDVKDVTVYPERNKVYIQGTMHNFIGSKVIKTKQETYMVEFKVFKGRLFFKELKKIEEGEF